MRPPSPAHPPAHHTAATGPPTKPKHDNADTKPPTASTHNLTNPGGRHDNPPDEPRGGIVFWTDGSPNHPAVVSISL
jgi:hypothetical protein